MTVVTDLNRITYDGDGTTTVFPYTFRIFADSNLVVTVTVIATSADTVQTITTHYTVSGAGDAGGGNVTMLTAPTALQRLTIQRVLPLTQTLDPEENEATPAQSWEDAFDKLTMICQQLAEEIDRALKQIVSVTGSNLNFPEPSALKGLRWNADADGLENVTLATEGEDFKTYTTSFTNSDLVSGVLTVTHSLNAKYTQVAVYDNDDKLVVPDEVTLVNTISLTIDLSSYGTITGTWHIRVMA